MKTVMTLHIPEPICLRQTMMHTETEPYDGKIDETQCGVCLRMSDKVPPAIAKTLGLLLPNVTQPLKKTLHQFPSPRIRQLGITFSTPAIAAQDPRIQIKPVLPREDVTDAIAQFDLLAVPSQALV